MTYCRLAVFPFLKVCCSITFQSYDDGLRLRVFEESVCEGNMYPRNTPGNIIIISPAFTSDIAHDLHFESSEVSNDHESMRQWCFSGEKCSSPF